jgi:flagellar protein FlaJ
MFAIVQASFLFVIHTVAPKDPIWQESPTEHSPMHRVRPALFGSVVLVGLAIAGVVLVGTGNAPIAADAVPLAVLLAIPTTPLLVPGLFMRREEKRVVDRDNGFPSFIRALGGVESVKQTSTANVLESLRKKDFGPLTDNVDDLYKRLRTRIDTEASWRLFAAETGSYLIQKFGDMYVVGRRMGGDPRELGQVISTNFNEVLRVREQRRQATTTFIGIVYGVTAASMFSAFIGLGVAEQMLEITSGIAEGNEEFVDSLFSTASYDIAVIEFLLLTVVLLNALFSSVMIRITDRGHFVSGLTHFVALVWTGTLVATVTEIVVAALLS